MFWMFPLWTRSLDLSEFSLVYHFFEIYSTRNSITFSAVGFGKNSAFGLPESLSTDTSKYFVFKLAFWKGPAKSNDTSSFGWFAGGNFPNSFWDFMHLKFSPATRHSLQILALSIVSLNARPPNIWGFPQHRVAKCMARSIFSRISLGMTKRWSMYKRPFESTEKELDFSLQGGGSLAITAVFLLRTRLN